MLASRQLNTAVTSFSCDVSSDIWRMSSSVFAHKARSWQQTRRADTRECIAAKEAMLSLVSPGVEISKQDRPEAHGEMHAPAGAWPRSPQAVAYAALLCATRSYGNPQHASVQLPSWLCPVAKTRLSEILSSSNIASAFGARLWRPRTPLPP